MKKLPTLVVVFLLAFGTRLYFNMSSHSFGDSDSYYVLRQVEHIQKTGLPIFNDRLSFGGKITPMLPAYYYLLSGARLFGSWFAFKLLPAVLTAVITLVAYLIASEFTKDWRVSAISGFFAGFVPAFFRLSVNSISPQGPLTVLVFLCVLFFLKLEKTKRTMPWLLACSILLALTSPFVLALCAILWVYMGLIKMRGMKFPSKSFEFVLFFTSFVLFVNLLAYVWTGLEKGVLGILAPASQFFTFSLDWTRLISGANALVLLLGVYGAYQGVKQETKKRAPTLLISFGLVIILLGSMKVVGVEIVLSYLGIVLSITSVHALAMLFDYSRKLRFAKRFLPALVAMVVLSVVFVSGFYEGFAKPGFADNDIKALKWLNNTQAHMVSTLAPLEYGHLVTFFAGTKDIADTNFVNSKDIEQRLRDIKEAYTTPYETQAIAIFDRYNVKYILLSPAIEREFGIKGLGYTSDKKCFTCIYNNTAEIYEVKCKLR